VLNDASDFFEIFRKLALTRSCFLVARPPAGYWVTKKGDSKGWPQVVSLRPSLKLTNSSPLNIGRFNAPKRKRYSSIPPIHFEVLNSLLVSGLPSANFILSAWIPPCCRLTLNNALAANSRQRCWLHALRLLGESGWIFRGSFLRIIFR